MERKNAIVRFAKRATLVVALAVGLPMLANSAQAQSLADFVFVNNTGLVISSVRFKAHGTRYWGNDVLLDNVLLPGGVAPIEFYSVLSCYMDIQLTYLDGRQDQYLEGRDLCRTTGISFTYGYLSSW